jgi:hypothetical protein
MVVGNRCGRLLSPKRDQSTKNLLTVSQERERERPIKQATKITRKKHGYMMDPPAGSLLKIFLNLRSKCTTIPHTQTSAELEHHKGFLHAVHVPANKSRITANKSENHTKQKYHKR